jgi:hypothetical protein
MPKKLRDWEAYNALKKRIEDFQLVLPLQEAWASIGPTVATSATARR